MNLDLLPQINYEDLKGNVNTVCKKCIFREGNPQTGCSYHNRLDKFIDKGLAYKVEESEDSYCAIKWYCTACTQKVPDGENPVEYIDKILSQRVDFIINYGSLKNIVRTYETAVNQELIPKTIIVMFRSEEYTPYDLYVALSQPELNRPGTKFYIVQAKRGTSYNETMNMCIEKCKSQFFTIFEAGDKVPYNFCSTIDHLINRELQQFICVKSDTSGTVLLTNLFKKLIKIQREDDLNRPDSIEIEEAILEMTVPGANEKAELFLLWNN